MNFLILLVFFFLLLASYQDIKKKELENVEIACLMVFGLVYRLMDGQFLVTIVGMALMFLYGYFLWRKCIFGGADAKLITCLVPFLFINGYPNMLVSIGFFIIELGVIGIIYSSLHRLTSKKKKIAFIPAIALTFLVHTIFFHTYI